LDIGVRVIYLLKEFFEKGENNLNPSESWFRHKSR